MFDQTPGHQSLTELTYKLYHQHLSFRVAPQKWEFWAVMSFDKFAYLCWAPIMYCRTRALFGAVGFKIRFHVYHIVLVELTYLGRYRGSVNLLRRGGNQSSEQCTDLLRGKGPPAALVGCGVQLPRPFPNLPGFLCSALCPCECK